MQHPPGITDYLSRQVKNSSSGRSQRRLKVPFAHITDEKERQAMIERRRQAAKASHKSPRKRSNRGALQRLLNAYRAMNQANHANARAIARQLKAMK